MIKRAVIFSLFLSLRICAFSQSSPIDSLKLLSNHFPENFILYKPFDMVSGDFYSQFGGEENKKLQVSGLKETILSI